MKTRFLSLLLFGLAIVLSGCKLAVIVVEGGQVWSENSGTCAYQDKICIVDVSDPTFSENFTAVPNHGFYFEKWNAGDRLLCGGSTEQNCTLSLEGYEENELVQAMVASSETFYLMPIFRTQTHQDTVEVDGREWLQPFDLVGTPEQVRAVCPGGVCSGKLPESDFDLTGYRWASIDEVIELFNSYGVEPPFTGPDQIRENQTGAAKIFNDFKYLSDISTRHIYGFARDGNSEGSVYVTMIGWGSTGTADFTITDKFADDFSSPITYAWFWRPAQ